jgi:hypothetical protein
VSFLGEVSNALGRVVVRVMISIAVPRARLLEHVESGSRGGGRVRRGNRIQGTSALDEDEDRKAVVSA